jgi:LPPG:FO 2-phospho-L-lactate transferase
MGELSKMGDQVWFQVGDLDLATHLYRTEMLSKNIALSRITHNLCRAWDIHVSILPATDCKVPTIVHTREGESLSFQEYFVHRGCLPEVKAFEFQGVAAANPAAGVAEAIGACDLVLVAPSNPWVSVDPILSITGIRAALEAKPVIAVSPIIGGKTIKGPAAKMFAELGIIPSASSVAEHYGKLLKGFVLDETDREQKGDIDRRGIMTLTTNILMGPDRDRGRLAREVLDFAKNQLQVAI